MSLKWDKMQARKADLYFADFIWRSHGEKVARNWLRQQSEGGGTAESVSSQSTRSSEDCEGRSREIPRHHRVSGAHGAQRGSAHGAVQDAAARSADDGKAGIDRDKNLHQQKGVSPEIGLQVQTNALGRSGSPVGSRQTGLRATRSQGSASSLIDLAAARGLMYTDAAHLVADQFAEAAGSDADDECV